MAYGQRRIRDHAAAAGHAGPVLANCDDSVSKDLWLEQGWRERNVPEEQLFDLVFDPNESHNLADNPGCQAVLADMRSRLQAWMERTEDPLLDDGPVPTPSGAIINKIDATSPGETAGLFAVTV